MEASAAETASAADLEELFETSGSASTDSAAHDQAPAGHAAETPTVEGKDSQTFPNEEETNGFPLSPSKEGAGQASVFSALSFPQKLWVLAESDQVKSIWWGHGGNCLVIEEQLFMVEVLAKEAPVRAFGCTGMKSFVRQLNRYGFTKVPRDLERSPSLPEFLAEEEATAAQRKLLLYSCPLFRRDDPGLLEHCKLRAARKRRAEAAPSPGLQEALNESPQKSSPGSQSTQAAAAGPERSLQAAEPQGTQAAASVGPPPAKLPKTDSPGALAGSAHRAPAPQQCQALPCSTLPASSSPMLGAARAPPPHAALPFVLPTFTPGSPRQELSQAPRATPQLQAAWDALPFLSFCFAMAMRAAATMMPAHRQPRAAPHCPMCSCNQHQADASHGTAP
ncbi:heat shock transcription factor, X-linked-like [Meleagris gallopavo]|uniref:HSF-type DNA-binding domain-containing protein n=1 Tax=Meleagris gallopavo TaxID=9103 RepID=G1MX54_MELGA|nr:heat shock transcription factor, X-linked-like [Meleagris gallopavo]